MGYRYIGEGFVELLGVLAILAVVGIVGLLVGAGFGIAWLVHHVRFA